MSVRLGARLEADATPFVQALATAEAGLQHFEATAAAVARQVAAEFALLAGAAREGTAGWEATPQALVRIEQAGTRTVPVLQAVGTAGDDGARALAALGEGADGAGSSLTRWGEQAGALVPVLQQVGGAGDDTARALVAVGDGAGAGGQSLDHWAGAAQSAGRSVDTAGTAFAGMAEDAGRVATTVERLPLLFEIFIAALAVDIGLRVVSALKDEIVALGEAIGHETLRLHQWLQEQEGVAGAAERLVERLAVSRGLAWALTRAGVAAEVANPLGWAVGAALSLDALAGRAQEAMAAADAAAEAHKKLEAELERTGHAAGLAGTEVEAMAHALAMATRFGGDAFVEAGRQMLQYRTVTSEVFGEALRLAADLAVKTGRDLPAAVTLLGQALEAPATSFTALSEAGVRLSFAQRQQIQDFEALGRHAEAQRLVMAAVAETSRGASSVMDENARAAHRLEESWDHLAVLIGQRLNALKAWLTVSLDLGITRWFDTLVAEANEGWARLLSPEPIERRIVAVNRALVEAQQTLAQAEREAATGFDAALSGASWVEQTRQQVAGLQAQLDALIAQARQAAAAQDAVLAGRQDQEALRHAERLAALQKELEAGSASLFPPGEAEKIEAINAELARTRAILDSLRNADGSNAAQIEALAAGYERLAGARRQAVQDEGQTRREQEIHAAIEAEGALIDKRHEGVAAIEGQIAALGQERERLGESSRERAVVDAVLRAEKTARKAGIALTDDQRAALEREAGALADSRAALEKKVDANARLIECLEAERDLLHLSERERTIEQTVRRLSAEATDDQRRQVRELAGALLDERQAIEANTRAQQVLVRLREQLAEIGLDPGDAAAARVLAQLGAGIDAATRAEAEALARRLEDAREAKRIWESVQDEAERYEQTLDRLNHLLEAGAIDQETYGRAAEQAYARMLADSEDWADGVERAWDRWRDAAFDGAAQAERVFTDALRGMEDVFVGFVTRGEINFARLTQSVLEDLTRIFWQREIMGPIGDALFGGGDDGGGFFSSLFGGGGGGMLDGIGSWFSGLFAQGAAFEGGAVVPFAEGGVISWPTLFPLFGGRTGLMGEAGPEAILPLRRTTDGRLGVEALGSEAGGGALTLADARASYVIQVDARGASDPEATSEMVRQAVAQALARAVPGIVEHAAGVAYGAVVDGYHRRGGRFT